MQSLQIKESYKKIYSISESGIVITTYENPNLPAETHIRFENIRRDKIFYVSKSYVFLAFSGLALMLFVIVLSDSLRENNDLYLYNFTWPVLSLVSFVLFFTYRHKVYFLKTFTGNYIKFRVKRNEQQIDEFVKAVLKSRDEYLKAKYGVPNSYLSYDAQYSNFGIMLSEKIITQNEYFEKVEQLNQIFKQSSPTNTSFIGYSHN